MTLSATRVAALKLMTALLVGCATGGGPGAVASRPPAASPPAMLLGSFTDDYSGGPTISATRWEQGPGTVYLPLAWHPDEQYVIARNAASNTTAPGRYTRIDWLVLPEGQPYRWGYCLSAFDAPTADSAEATRIADRSRPRTGCNGFPFTRLKPRSVVR